MSIRHRIEFGVALTVVLLTALTDSALGQTQRSSVSSRIARRTGERSDADRAAGEFIDSLFRAEPPVDPLSPRNRQANAAADALGGRPSVASRNRSWSAILERNPSTEDGSPAYVLLDRYGKVKRYVESSKTIELDDYLGETVTVRRDTGQTLLASQLALPRIRTDGAMRDDQLQRAQFAEDLPPGAVLEEPTQLQPEPAPPSNMIVPEGVDPLYLDEGYQGGGYQGDYQGDGLNFGGCPNCGSQVCPQGGCGYGSRPVMYVRGEYLLWWLEGMNTPPLVSQLLPPAPATEQVIYGGDRILNSGRSGYRVTAGYWFDDYGKWGVEGDYLDLGTLNETFSAGSLDGQTPAFPIVRPFIFAAPFPTSSPTDAAGSPGFEEVDTPNLDGSVTVQSSSQFQAAGIRFRHGICCKESSVVGCGDCVSGCDSCSTCGAAGATDWLPGVKRIDFVYGLRWASLNERLAVTENLAERSDPTSTYFVNDQFGANNRFFGGELGFDWEWQHQRWSLDMLSKIAIGNTRQLVNINGSTLFDGTPPAESGGLLAQRSNAGSHQRDQFSVLPELTTRLGYMMTDRLQLSIGYTFLYWSNVVRPGDQIDQVVDANQVPRLGGSNNVDAASPQFRFIETGVWVQGLDFGAEYRW